MKLTSSLLDVIFPLNHHAICSRRLRIRELHIHFLAEAAACMMVFIFYPFLHYEKNILFTSDPGFFFFPTYE